MILWVGVVDYCLRSFFPELFSFILQFGWVWCVFFFCCWLGCLFVCLFDSCSLLFVRWLIVCCVLEPDFGGYRPRQVLGYWFLLLIWVAIHRHVVWLSVWSWMYRLCGCRQQWRAYCELKYGLVCILVLGWVVWFGLFLIGWSPRLCGVLTCRILFVAGLFCLPISTGGPLVNMDEPFIYYNPIRREYLFMCSIVSLPYPVPLFAMMETPLKSGGQCTWPRCLCWVLFIWLLFVGFCSFVYWFVFVCSCVCLNMLCDGNCFVCSVQSRLPGCKWRCKQSPVSVAFV